MAHLFKSNKDISPPMFKNGFVDYFSRVHFSIPLFIFLPVLALLTYRSLGVLEIEFIPFTGTVVAGLLSWTLFEYAIHRWLFHWHPKAKWGARLHFIVHGVHHDYPNDTHRLVMPPAVSIGLSLIFFTAFYLVFGPVWSHPVFVGFGLGYLFYDMTHYAVHNLKFNNKYFKTVQKHHMYHHYKNPNAGFGFTSKFWDWVFRTRQSDVAKRETKALKQTESAH
ncbi:MAG: sterol desaturase family protein [Bacteroidia bacterium]|nr:sterol desaturase family protein [Bacteroidia bacterium]